MLLTQESHKVAEVVFFEGEGIVDIKSVAKVHVAMQGTVVRCVYENSDAHFEVALNSLVQFKAVHRSVLLYISCCSSLGTTVGSGDA